MTSLRKRSPFWLSLIAALLVIAWMVRAFQPAHADNAQSIAATYIHGTLRVTIPYAARNPGRGQLTVDVLDPEDHILGHAEQPVATGPASGTWQADVRLAKALAVEDLAWQRVRYVYKAQNAAVVEDTESVSRILRMPVLHIIGQQSYVSGAEAAVRVVVTDSKDQPITGRNALRIQLESQGPARTLFSGWLNPRGTTEAQFHLAAGLAGRYTLRYTVDTPIGSTEFTQPVRVEDKVSILLTTEKPLYQPGQTIHIRALALDRANHAAAAGRKLTFEVQDSRGNKVFKKAAQTDSFGVASAEFSLADEVNLGTYHLRALMDETNTSEIALNVERYLLPKFKVAFDFGAGEQTKHGYRPGDHVTGTVHAIYFFGKPVDGGTVSLKASTMDVAVNEITSAAGKTDTAGAWHFDLRLPDYLAGRPLTQGAARVLIEATVKDSAGHSETRGEPITVSESPLLLTAVPEGGKLIPNLENQVFLLASYPDGKPAAATAAANACSS